MNRTEIIQHYIDKIKSVSYLEIGVQNGQNFNKIVCAKKVGVDPDKNSKATINFTSDDFFKNNKDQKFDVIFLDGLHHSMQLLKDINNALNCLADGGYIVCHDINPKGFDEQLVPRETRHWNGDCWIAWTILRATRNDLSMFVVNTDEGCGVIRKGNQETIDIDCNLTYEKFRNRKTYWLNLIDISEFKST